MSFVRETLALHSVAPDLLATEAPVEAWSNGDGAVFRDGRTEALRQGVPVLGPPSGPVRVLVYVEPFDAGYWVYASEAGIFAHDGATEYDITPAGWAPGAGGIWTGCVVNGLAVINVSTADPVFWDGVTGHACQPLPDWPAGGRCLAMRAHKNFLFAVGMISESGQRVRWSAAAEAGVIPQEWTPKASNEAGFVDLAPLSSDAVDGLSMRDEFMVYKRESIWALSLIGGQLVFGARKVFAESGAAATGAVCRGPNDEHLLIGSDGDAHIHDGVNLRSILDGRAQRYFYAELSAGAGRIFSAACLMREKLGILTYPATDAAAGTRAILYDFASGDIGFAGVPGVLCLAEGRGLRDVGQGDPWDNAPDPWDTETAAWNAEIDAASVQDVVMGLEAGAEIFAGGESVAAVSLEKTGLSFGDARRRKLISRLWPRIEGHAGDVIYLRAVGQERAGGPTEMGPRVAYEIGREDPVETLVQGRFLGIVLEAPAGIGPWSLSGIDVEFRGVGGW